MAEKVFYKNFKSSRSDTGRDLYLLFVTVLTAGTIASTVSQMAKPEKLANCDEYDSGGIREG